MLEGAFFSDPPILTAKAVTGGSALRAVQQMKASVRSAHEPHRAADHGASFYIAEGVIVSNIEGTVERIYDVI